MLEGYNGTVMAYGQTGAPRSLRWQRRKSGCFSDRRRPLRTDVGSGGEVRRVAGSGKTHTLFGMGEELHKEVGIVARVCAALFVSIEEDIWNV